MNNKIILKAKITISKRSDGFVVIQINDANSGLVVVSAKMSLANFADAITGTAMVESDFCFIPDFFIAENIGKTKETMLFFVDKKPSKEMQIDEVFEQFAKSPHPKEGWMVFDDGIGTQQPGNLHKAILRRFV